MLISGEKMFRKILYTLILLINGLAYAIVDSFPGNIQNNSEHFIEKKTGFHTYYHTTRIENIDSIKKDGLLPGYGASKEKKGMSCLHQSALTKQFTQGSLNTVCVSQDWETLVRYTEHMAKLLGLEKLPAHSYSKLFSDFPVVLKVDAHKYTFSPDPDDKKGLCVENKIPPDDIFVLVKENTEYTIDDQDEDAVWLPLSQYSPTSYKPAYCDTDNKDLKLDIHMKYVFLEKRIGYPGLLNISKLMSGVSDLFHIFEQCSAKDTALDVGNIFKCIGGLIQTVICPSHKEIEDIFDQTFPLLTSFDYHFIHHDERVTG